VCVDIDETRCCDCVYGMGWHWMALDRDEICIDRVVLD